MNVATLLAARAPASRLRREQSSNRSNVRVLFGLERLRTVASRLRREQSST